MNNNAKLSAKDKAGYGIASIGDAVVYSIVSIFLVYYLTSVVKMGPGTAGTVSAVALFISAVVTFFIGHISDNSNFKSGRRRPFIKVALPIMVIAFIGLFSSFGFTGTACTVYYLFFAVLFWISYSMFFVPWNALGAEITTDYDERSSLRAYAAVFNQSGNFCATVFTMILMGALSGVLGSQKAGWQVGALIFIAISASAIAIMVKSTKGKELITDTDKNKPKSNLFKDYFWVISAKPTKYLLVAIIGYMIVNTIFTSNLTFFVTIKLGMPESTVSLIFAIVSVLAIVLTPLINVLAQRLGKKKALVICFVIPAVMLVAGKIIGTNGMGMLIFLGVMFSVAASAYWQLMAAALYDLTEVVELKSGIRAEGTISSLQSITQQIGAALASLILGWSLEMGGFNETAAVQPDSALNAVEFAQTVIPAAGLAIAAICVALFPLNKKTFLLVQKALDDKKNKGDYDREGLERII